MNDPTAGVPRAAGDAFDDPASPGGTQEPSIVQVIAEYAAAGFDGDAFVTEDGRLQCGACDRIDEPAAFETRSVRRLEGQSDPADMSGVLAVVCPHCGARATVVLRYGPEADATEVRVWRTVGAEHRGEQVPPSSTPAEGG